MASSAFLICFNLMHCAASTSKQQSTKCWFHHCRVGFWQPISPLANEGLNVMSTLSKPCTKVISHTHHVHVGQGLVSSISAPSRVFPHVAPTTDISCGKNTMALYSRRQVLFYPLHFSRELFLSPAQIYLSKKGD